MQISLAPFLLTILLELGHVDFSSSVGSKTYETSNGFPVNFLNDLVNSDVVKQKLKSRWRWEVWDVVPGMHAYQIYVFNVTNPGEVENGGKPVLQQVGPYSYKEYRYKFDVAMNLDMTVNFERNFTYTFDPSRSKGSETDQVNIINVPLIIFSTLASKNSKGLSDANDAVKALVETGETLVKRKVRVDDLLFHGIDVSKYTKYLNLLGPSTPLTDEFRDGLFAVLKLKNGVHEGQFTVDSGLKVDKNVGKITTYNGLEKLTYWNGDTCNKIQGSDGSVFPPHLQTSDKLSMLEVDLCRSVSFSYSRDIQFKSVLGNVFQVDKSVLEDPSVNKDNQCFCPKDDSCLKQGVLDISSCRYGAPFVMSYAHFLDASPDYQQAVTGMKPDKNIHQTEVTVEPVTGAVINFHKRYQWNIWIRPINGIDYFKKFPATITPILWNDDVFTLDPDKEELLLEELAAQSGGMGSGSEKRNQWSRNISVLLFILFAVVIFGN